MDIKKELQNRILVLDGAMGTMLQAYKFSEEDLIKLILIMFYSFKSYDFVDYLISMMDEKYGTNILDKYRLLNKNLKIIKKY